MNCQICNAEFEQRRHNQIYCTQKCKRRSEYLKSKTYVDKARIKAIKVCQECGNSFIPTVGHKMFCNVGCKRQNNKKTLVKELISICCRFCDNKFEAASTSLVKYCSDDCRRKQNTKSVNEYQKTRRAEKITVVYEKECPTCKKQFNTKMKSQKYCAASCSKNGVKSKEKYWEIAINLLLERDNNTCHLCGEKVDTSKKVPNYFAPVIEHKKPKILGGDNSCSNVGLAHFGCNTKKGSIYPYENIQ